MIDSNSQCRTQKKKKTPKLAPLVGKSAVRRHLAAFAGSSCWAPPLFFSFFFFVLSRKSDRRGRWERENKSDRGNRNTRTPTVAKASASASSSSVTQDSEMKTTKERKRVPRTRGPPGTASARFCVWCVCRLFFFCWLVGFVLFRGFSPAPFDSSLRPPCRVDRTGLLGRLFAASSQFEQDKHLSGRGGNVSRGVTAASQRGWRGLRAGPNEEARLMPEMVAGIDPSRVGRVVHMER